MSVELRAARVPYALRAELSTTWKSIIFSVPFIIKLDKLPYVVYYYAVCTWLLLNFQALDGNSICFWYGTA